MGMSLSLQVLGEHLGLRNAKKEAFLVTRGLLWGSFGDLLGPGCHGQVPRLTYSGRVCEICMQAVASLTLSCSLAGTQRTTACVFLWACHEPKTLDEIRITNSQ